MKTIKSFSNGNDAQAIVDVFMAEVGPMTGPVALTPEDVLRVSQGEDPVDVLAFEFADMESVASVAQAASDYLKTLTLKGVATVFVTPGALNLEALRHAMTILNHHLPAQHPVLWGFSEGDAMLPGQIVILVRHEAEDV